jgi:hypothetical protein
MTALHTLGILSTSFTWIVLSKSLEEILTYVEQLLAYFPSLCSPTHPKQSQLGSGQVIVEIRSSDAALHHSPSWSNSPYTAWRSCDTPTKRKPDGMAYRYKMLW